MTEEEFKERRTRNNTWIGVTLVAFVALVFAITVAKMMAGHNMEAFDHVYRPQLDTVN